MDGDMHGNDPFSLAPETVTPGQLYVVIQSLSIRQGQLNNELIALRKELSVQSDATKDLVVAWKAGGVFLAFVKVVSIMATAALSFYGAVKLVLRFWGPA